MYYVDKSKIEEEQKYEILLKEIKDITDMSFMFNPFYCQIIQIDFSKWDVSNAPTGNICLIIVIIFLIFQNEIFQMLKI